MPNEIAYILVGRKSNSLLFARLLKRTKGTSTSVEFDWEWVLEREEKKGDILGFYHTHLHGLSISGRDVRTMMAWASCLGKSLFCMIASSFRNRTYLFPQPQHAAIFVYYPSWRLFKIFRLVLGVNL